MVLVQDFKRNKHLGHKLDQIEIKLKIFKEMTLSRVFKLDKEL